MIDVDKFKLYNDRYGHIAGDACLRIVAETLNQSIRQGTDLVARYGGEEFVIILPGADHALTLPVAERARAAVAALKLPHEGADSGIVTISIGIAATGPSAETTEQLIASADAALYEAKRSGRNRVVGNR
jgi:diguanylate cyclase (GGDEF)-like protein